MVEAAPRDGGVRRVGRDVVAGAPANRAVLGVGANAVPFATRDGGIG